jgi:hypothetical protein
MAQHVGYASTEASECYFSRANRGLDFILSAVKASRRSDLMSTRGLNKVLDNNDTFGQIDLPSDELAQGVTRHLHHVITFYPDKFLNDEAISSGDGTT